MSDGDSKKGKLVPNPRKPGRRGASGPTITDVAREAGVAIMTVSRVVNGGSYVSLATEKRVRAAIRAYR